MGLTRRLFCVYDVFSSYRVSFSLTLIPIKMLPIEMLLPIKMGLMGLTMKGPGPGPGPGPGHPVGFL